MCVWFFFYNKMAECLASSNRKTMSFATECETFCFTSLMGTVRLTVVVVPTLEEME